MYRSIMLPYQFLCLGVIQLFDDCCYSCSEIWSRENAMFFLNYKPTPKNHRCWLADSEISKCFLQTVLDPSLLWQLPVLIWIFWHLKNCCEQQYTHKSKTEKLVFVKRLSYSGRNENFGFQNSSNNTSTVQWSRILKFCAKGFLASVACLFP